MNCQTCGFENPPGFRFCGQCAAPLSETSGRERDPRAYTPKHLADRILTQRSALEGERKHLTVLFADVAGYTSLSERAGPDEMHMLMDRCFQLILPEVHRYEGTVNQFTGDGVMALFGAPLALEDAPRRAILAGLGIQRVLEPLREEVRSEHGTEFQMRIGIHSGLVVVGKIGDDLRMDYTAVGDTTNLANRLQGHARPGAILISEATERLARGYFELRDLGPAELKGKSESVRVFDVLAERRVSGRLEAVAPSEWTPFVGRERELDMLREAFDVARGGRGQVAFVVGEAGLGKSRLLLEFQRRLGDGSHVWILGQCAALARNTPFGMMVDALRRGFGIEDRDDEAGALAKIERAQEELGRDLDWTLPFVLQLLSLPVSDPTVAEMDPAARRSETFRALQARFVRAAEREPLVFVVEDLHWIDAASEELLVYLSDAIAATRTLLVLTHRPGYQRPFGDRSHHVRIRLPPLSDGEMTAMTEFLLESATLPDAIRGQITGKAEGNPFFVEEVTKSLLEQGVLRQRDGALELAAELTDVGVPDSIQDVLMARLDRLADGPKRALQVASVIGREFALQLLERIAEAGHRVATVVEELQALELILQTAAYPELAFMFKHALTHDVAYETIVVPRRRALHRIAGAAIEELYSDRLAEHYEALAHHFSEGEDWERALLYHEYAANKATAAYANQAAAAHCRQALAIAERLKGTVADAKREGLEVLLGAACSNVSEFMESGDAFLRAAELTDAGAVRAMYVASAGWSILNSHDDERTLQTVDQALTLSRQHGAHAAHSIALFSRSWWKESKGDPVEDHIYDEAEELAEQSGDPVARMLAIGVGQGLRAEWRGDFRRALAHCEKGVAIALEARLCFAGLFPRWGLGLAVAALGQYDRAIAELGQALALADRIGARAMKTRLLNSLGWCFAEFGCYDRAREYNEQAVRIALELAELEGPTAEEFYANGAANLASNKITAGDLDGARELLEPMHALDRPSSWAMRWRYSLHILDGLARVALAQSDPERALSLIHQELAGARKFRAQKIEARALELEGRVLATIDRRDEAEASLRAALDVAGRIEYPPVIWRARSLLGELARRRAKGDEAEAEAAKARTLVEMLARDLSNPDHQRELRALGDRMIADPLGAYR